MSQAVLETVWTSDIDGLRMDIRVIWHLETVQRCVWLLELAYSWIWRLIWMSQAVLETVWISDIDDIG